MEIITFVIKPMKTTEYRWPTYIQRTAILRRLSSFTMISLSFVVKPEPVKSDATWNLTLFEAKPVNLKATEKALIVKRYNDITAKINATANQIFIINFFYLSFCCFYIVHNYYL